MINKITARAPSSTANLGPGFDVFGLALDAFYDTVTLEAMRAPALQVEVHGEYGKTIPVQPEANSAGLVVKKMCEQYKIEIGLKVTVEKGIPPGYGLGSSAASASAAAVALNTMFDLQLDRNALVKAAAIGEIASAGTTHYDNVSASLLGGFVIVRAEPLSVVRIDAPKDLILCVAVPKVNVPQKKTEASRSVLPALVSLKQLTQNVANACMVVTGFVLSDLDLISKGIDDVVVEPARKHLIPGYDYVKKNALHAGALAVTISGAGPSMIAITRAGDKVDDICNAMKRGFRSANVDSKAIACKVSDGTKVV
ncbi:MAG: homoserine kinase [Nitrososphaerales archaeon]